MTVTVWIITYLIGAGVTAWIFSGFGWVPGKSRGYKIVSTTLCISFWPGFLFLLLLSGIDSIARPQR